jgi:hypothetical protein
LAYVRQFDYRAVRHPDIESLFCQQDTRKRIAGYMGQDTVRTDELQQSAKKVGQLYPILTDRDGRVIDGEHRLHVNKNWHCITLDHIKTEKQWLVARIVSNNVRRTVPHREKRLLLQQLADVLLAEGVSPGRIAYKIADETGMSYRWVTKYLPMQFKDERQSARARAAARHAAPGVRALLNPPKKQGSVVVKAYTNAEFVALTIDKRFYEDFERHSVALGVVAETSILKALEEYNEKMKRALRLANNGKLDEAASVKQSVSLSQT